jgi:hypothetical protein
MLELRPIASERINLAAKLEKTAFLSSLSHLEIRPLAARTVR